LYPRTSADTAPGCGKIYGLVCAHDERPPLPGEHLERLNVWATKLRSFQLALDLNGGDRDAVARVAGNLLDLAEEIGARSGAFYGRVGARCEES
jgi:hypothetical protein